MDDVKKKIDFILNKDITLNNKTNDLMDLRIELDQRFDKILQLIDTETLELEKNACKNCEGLGSFRYHEYFSQCHECGGTGHDRT